MLTNSTKNTNKVLTLGEWNDILLRDSLEDIGVIPSPGYPYTSPDVICTQQQQVDPTQFTQNYGSDPNLPVIAKQNNFMYVRGKNLGTQPSGGTVYLYWCESSLLMLPDQWKQNAMQANVGGQWQPYNTLPQVEGSQISVTQAPFAWAPSTLPAGQHYCTIGAVSTPTHPWSTNDIPPFPTWDDFVMWVRNHQNICWRNLTLLTNPNQPEWDRLDLVSLPGTAPVPMLVKAQCTNVPIGTTVMLKNDQLGIQTSVVTDNVNQTIYSNGVTCPAGYIGYIETLAQVAQGQIWPTGAAIETILYLGTEPNKPVAKFAHDFGTDNKHPSVVQARGLVKGTMGGVLVAVGNCSTKMQPV